MITLEPKNRGLIEKLLYPTTTTKVFKIPHHHVYVTSNSNYCSRLSLSTLSPVLVISNIIQGQGFLIILILSFSLTQLIHS